MANDVDDQYSSEEAARRRDAVLKIMVNPPPQPHATRPSAQPKKRKPAVADRIKPKASDRLGKP
jgi:hypothetical protein